MDKVVFFVKDFMVNFVWFLVLVVKVIKGYIFISIVEFGNWK